MWKREPKTSSTFFQLACGYTPIILIGLFIITFSVQSFDSPLQCDAKEVTMEKIVTYMCWASKNLTLPEIRANQSAFPDIEPQFAEWRIQYRAFFYGMPLVLMAQAILFSLPSWIWSNLEAGLMGSLTSGMHHGVMPSDERSAKVRNLAQYLILHRPEIIFYLSSYLFCEIMCAFILIMQIFLLNLFLGGDFLYALLVNQKASNGQVDFVFPKVVKCKFELFNLKGQTVQYDTLCAASKGFVYEKCYVLVWALC